MRVENNDRTAIVFLCKDLKDDTAKFANDIYLQTNFEVFAVVDNEIKTTDSYKFSVLKIKDEVCKENGYIGCNISGKETHIQKEVIAWDKFLYLFCECFLDYDYVWVFEDDVFIPEVKTIEYLHKKYLLSADLVTPNNFRKDDNVMDWHWRHITDKIKAPYFYSMVCACGMSKKMLQKIKDYVSENKKLFYIEVMFNTLAMQDRNMLVKDPVELKSIVWMGEWGIDEFLILPNSVFHPIKENHYEYRLAIQKAKEINYKPKNKLPEFITKYLKNV